MATGNIDVILSQLGWQDGFRIPVANEENKRLEEEIARKTKHKVSLSAKLENLEERLKMILKHAGDLTARREFNHKLLAEHSVQLETEDHLYRLTGNAESSLRQETREFEKEWTDVNRRVASVEKELVRMTRKLDEAKQMVQFDEDSLRKWEEMLARKDEDNQLIEDYMKQDTQKYKELEQKRQKLRMELEIYRQAIVKTVDEVQEMEIVLDRTAKLYMEALKERRQMINQWTQSVNVLRQRDNDIQNSLKELETLREIDREKKNNLEEVEQFLKDQIVNNKQLEQLIKHSEKELGVVQEKQRKITETIDIYSIELQTQKKLVADLARRVQQIRANVKRKRIEIENKHIKVDDCKKRINDLMSTLEELESQKLNVEERTKRLEKMIEHDEKRKSVIVKELSRLQATTLRTMKRIVELESERKTLQMEMQGEHKKVDLLDALLAKENKFLGEKKETLYQEDFNLQKCEMKLERLRGYERDKSEVERKQARIEELQAVLKEKTATSKLLQNQILSLEHDMKKLSSCLSSENEELERLRSKKQDLLLLLDGGEKRLKIAQSRNEERQVEENMMRLRVSQLERMTSNMSDKVYDLEKYRLHLEAALKERATEIAAQKEALAVQKRVAGNECSELRIAIAERRGRIRQLQARYDCGLVTMGDTPDGAPISTAYLKIQSAQERYMLREQGDKLDEAIQRTEQEIRSMENTLRVVNVCNDKYRDSISAVDQDAPEWTEQRRLDELMHNARQKLMQKQTQLQRLFDELQKAQNNHTQMLEDIEKAKEDKEDKERYLSGIEKQTAEQGEKISRADKSLRKAQKDIQNLYISKRDDTVLLQQREVELRELQEQNALVLQDIAEFTIRHVEAEAYVKKLLMAKNVELPSFPPSLRSPLSPCGSSVGSIDQPLKSTSRMSVFTSSRESIGSVVKIEPQFDEPTCSASRKTAKRDTPSKESLLSKRSAIVHKKQQSRKKS
ncbi:PREDICTED: coiled-coil domain-containing protein 39 [Wasmannia auropunctata]|uniref:coiled-coil domain-containing protein 39 n=1 Tax=Wasmannia auropunctata TaxID=64793 RepID=UPI0005EE025E|nr:PREDICTED: coiled-coil domain-containing protein 39 [Wasmannia auropunctata]XP_011697658.1 PREDICTED: coiled-coil domain-containing protein 39 [Wasmannia auropunctata]XP_011697659.1 PREDICTED: coiled-coil domain-containing protein 39 [Wasmannia auropunctata]